MVQRTLISFPSQLQLIERLQHLLYLSSSMVFISGEKGSGKSTLIEQLSNQLPIESQQVFISLIEPISVAQIRLLIISQLFESPVFDEDDTLLNILLSFKDRQTLDVARVIVIDNADFLSEQALHELADVIKQKDSITDNEINFVLLCDESNNHEMVHKINMAPSTKFIATLFFKLTPLAFKEAQQLLNHCLEQVGYVAAVQHQDALSAQLANCKGIPEKILLLATEVSSGNIELEDPSWFKTRFLAISLMCLLSVIAAGLAFYIFPKFAEAEAEMQEIVETDSVLVDDIKSTNLTTQAQSSTINSEALAGQWSNDNVAITDTQLVVGVADDKNREVIAESELLALKQLSEQPVIDDQVTAMSSDKADEPSANAFLNADMVSAESNVVVEEIEEKPASELAVSQAIILEKKPVVKVKALEVAPDAPVVPVKNHKPFTTHAELLAIDPNFYTLQLAAMSSEKSLKDFIIEYKLVEDNISFYQTMRNGKKWYVVIYGQFESRKMALREVKKLANSPNKLEGWAKRYASVHQDLQLNE